MDHTTNILHLGLSIRPEWDPSVPVHWSNIYIETIASRQFAQLPGWPAVTEKIADIVQWELALPHVMQFHDKLNQITPCSGYQINPETQKVIVGNLTIATELSEVQPSEVSLLPACPINTPSSLPSSSSPLSSTTHHPSTLSQGRALRSMYMRVTSFGQEIVEGGTISQAGRVQRSNNDTPVGQSIPQAHTQQVTPSSSHTRSTPSWPSAQWLSPATSLVTSSSTTPSHQSAALSHIPASSCTPVHSAPAHPVPYSEPPQIVSMVNLPSPHPRLPLEHVRPLPASQMVSVVDISSSDKDDNTSSVRYTSSWVQTPTGLPHVLPLEVNNLVVPAPPPPAYYTMPLSADSFNFPLGVVTFLWDINVGPRALCTISASHDYDIESWVLQFMGVGLTCEAVEALHDLFIEVLMPDQLALLNSTVLSSPTASSVSTESSIDSMGTL